jgi:hypothetical protein
MALQYGGVLHSVAVKQSSETEFLLQPVSFLHTFKAGCQGLTEIWLLAQSQCVF